MPNFKRVKYETCLVSHIDLLGFRHLVQSKSAGEISRVLRVFSEAVDPERARFRVPELRTTQYVAFSDLHITVIPTRRNENSVRGLIFQQILRLIHAQSVLFFDYDIIIRGGVVVGDAVRSYGRFFGQAIIDAYDLESQRAIYPRVVVDKSVFREVSVNPALWTHGDPDSELQAVKSLLHHDEENGLYYIDFLRVMAEELNRPEMYTQYLKQFRDKTKKMIESANGNSAVRSKLEWMKRYHSRTERRAKRGK